MLNILGQEYDMQVSDALPDDTDGLCQTYSKKIMVKPMEKMLDPTDTDDVKRKRFNEVCRHEIIHAFLFESGLIDECSDEQLVNYLAMQMPKLIELFRIQNRLE